MVELDVTIGAYSTGAETGILTTVANASLAGGTIIVGEALWPVAAQSTGWIARSTW